MEYQISDMLGLATDADDFYLKITSVGNNISGYYVLHQMNGSGIGQFGNFILFKKVGIGVSAVGAPDELVGLIDLKEINQPNQFIRCTHS